MSDITRSSVTLSWQAPLSDGGAAVVAYVVERREHLSAAWSRVARVKPQTTVYTASNLAERTDYQFRVYAENVEGAGPPLTLDVPVSPRRAAGKPSAPSGRLRAKKSGESVLLDWNAPSDDGGSRITSYVVEYRDTDSLVWQRAAVVDAYTRTVAVHGLRDAAVGDYLFRVTAVNEMGTGEPLETDVSVRPSRPAAGVPGPPRGPLAVSDVLRNSMRLTWQPPLTDGESPISQYIVERQDVTTSAAAGAGWTRVDRLRPHVYSYTVPHLVDGHRYLYRVIAENEHGRGPPLETRNPVEAKSPFSVPGPPGSVRLIGITDDSVTIEWTPAATDGGRPVTRYVVERRDGQQQAAWTHVASLPARTTVCQVTGLRPDAAYYIRVAAENDEGVGFYREFVEPVRPMRPKNLPMAPTSLRVDGVTRDSVTLRWDAPPDTGGVPLSGYIVEQQDGGKTAAPGSAARWKVAAYVDPARTWWTVAGLVHGYEYWFRVRAENPDGAGSACTLSSAVVPKPVVQKPSAPVLLEVVGLTDDSVTLSWLSPERDGGSRIHGYAIQCREVGGGAPGSPAGWTTVKRIDSSDVLVACVEGLRDGASYRFRVYADNEAGSGPAVELRQPVVPRSQLGPPKMPDGPIRVIRVTRNMLAIHWSPPFDDGGYPIERYIVEKHEATRSHWTQVGVCSPDVTAFCVTDLAENQVYYFRVIAETAFGLSEPLELDKPIVPRRIFESAPMMEIESWMGDAVTSAATMTTSTASHYTMATTERTYSAYGDEPLTATQDTIAATQAWLTTRRY